VPLGTPCDLKHHSHYVTLKMEIGKFLLSVFSNIFLLFVGRVAHYLGLSLLVQNNSFTCYNSERTVQDSLQQFFTTDSLLTVLSCIGDLIESTTFSLPSE